PRASVRAHHTAARATRSTTTSQSGRRMYISLPTWHVLAPAATPSAPSPDPLQAAFVLDLLPEVVDVTAVGLVRPFCQTQQKHGLIPVRRNSLQPFLGEGKLNS